MMPRMTKLDLAPAAERMAALVGGVSDDQLGGVTPCPAYTLGDLLDHVGGAAIAFTAAARKTVPPGGSKGPSGDASRLEEGWRDRVRRDLDALAAAWDDSDAWTGTAVAGGVELPGEVAGLVVLDELVVHGWDVARSSGQSYDVDPASLEVVHGFVAQFSGPGHDEMRSGMFGPVVPVPDDAPLLDRVLGMAGRDPGWSPGSVVG
jgi:uncharacterized protein (TIGR03086 family)